MSAKLDLRCKNCGHVAGYHSSPVCGFDHGSRRADRCACDQWEGVVYDLDAAHARIADLIVERDAYMQALLDTIHALASKPPLRLVQLPTRRRTSMASDSHVPEGVLSLHDQQMTACPGSDVWPSDEGEGWECDNCGWTAKPVFGPPYGLPCPASTPKEGT